MTAIVKMKRGILGGFVEIYIKIVFYANYFGNVFLIAFFVVNKKITKFVAHKKSEYRMMFLFCVKIERREH